MGIFEEALIGCHIHLNNEIQCALRRLHKVS